MRNSIAVIAFGLLPAVSYAYQGIDDILWTEKGQFPAYPPEPKEPGERPIRFSVSSGIDHDSNLFRLSSTTDAQAAIGTRDKSETMYHLGAGFKADLPISRQHLLLEGEVTEHLFDRFSVLDYLGYKAGARWNWAAKDILSGNLGYRRQRFISSFGELQGLVKDLITEDHAFAEAGYHLTPRWKLRGGVDFFNFDHSDPTRRTLDNHTISGTLGIDYVTPASNSIGVQVKYTDGTFDNREFFVGSFVDNGFQEVEASVVANWNITAKSHIDARAGFTSRNHDQLSQRDFDSFTGRLSYDWKPLAKTLLNVSAWREIRSIEDVTASFVQETGVSVGPAWAPTSKIILQGKLVYEERDFRGDPGFALQLAPQREDLFRGAKFTAGYTPRRWIQLGAAWELGDRSSNVSGRQYDYYAVSGNVRINF